MVFLCKPKVSSFMMNHSKKCDRILLCLWPKVTIRVVFSLFFPTFLKTKVCLEVGARGVYISVYRGTLKYPYRPKVMHMHTCSEYFSWLLSVLLDGPVQSERPDIENTLINAPVPTLREPKVVWGFGSIANAVTCTIPVNKLILQGEWKISYSHSWPWE